MCFSLKLVGIQACSPAQLMALLVHQTRQPNAMMCPSCYPVWLANAGQNVIGILPKMASYVVADTTHSSLTRHTLNREGWDKVQPIYHSSTIHNDNQANFLQGLIDYQTAQPKHFTQPSPRYVDGFIGFISYDLSASHLVYGRSDNAYLSSSQPLAYFGHYDIYLTWQTAGWTLQATTTEAAVQLDEIRSWLVNLINTGQSPAPNALCLQPHWQYPAYAHAFHRVQDYLNAGDCYQINLTQCWQGLLTSGKLADFLPALQQATQAPFAGYLSLEDYELASCSPELFFTFTRDDQGELSVVTKPIKGTIPRGNTSQQDEALKQQLADSEKDKAENVMIVDLLRNDLGKYAKTGSVKVPTLFAIESFSNVHHMVSTITATLKADIHPLTVLFDSLPAGSITGTPKKRAVEIIHELEIQPRGAYCGTMGYLNFDGTGQWNVLIRTLQASANTVTLWAGGGVTVASDCQAEYQECFDKVGNLLGVLAQVSEF